MVIIKSNFKLDLKIFFFIPQVHLGYIKLAPTEDLLDLVCIPPFIIKFKNVIFIMIYLLEPAISLFWTEQIHTSLH